MENIVNNKDMIKLIYEAQSEEIDKIIKKVNLELKGKLLIKKVNLELKGKLQEVNLDEETFCKIEENYNIKISKYNEEIYKKGFIDGFNTILNCIK